MKIYTQLNLISDCLKAKSTLKKLWYNRIKASSNRVKIAACYE